MNLVLSSSSKHKKNSPLLAKMPKRLKPKGRQRPNECRDLFGNLSEYLDGRVEPLTCEQMRSHIEACPSCVAFLRDLRSAIDRCRSLEVACDSAIAVRLREILTREYLRMIVIPRVSKTLAHRNLAGKVRKQQSSACS
jgi:RNA polymerase sigma-70 factor (ECF subfamily)